MTTTKTPSEDAFLRAAAWLDCYEGEGDTHDGLEEVQSVMRWCERQAEIEHRKAEIRDLAASHGKPVRWVQRALRRANAGDR